MFTTYYWKHDVCNLTRLVMLFKQPQAYFCLHHHWMFSFIQVYGVAFSLFFSASVERVNETTYFKLYNRQRHSEFVHAPECTSGIVPLITRMTSLWNLWATKICNECSEMFQSIAELTMNVHIQIRLWNVSQSCSYLSSTPIFLLASKLNPGRVTEGQEAMKTITSLAQYSEKKTTETTSNLPTHPGSKVK